MKLPASPEASLTRAPLALERFTPYRLSILANTVSGALARRYRERFGLSVPQWRLMAVLGRQADLSASELCDWTEMDKVTVHRALAGLVADGRVDRRRDPADGRRSLLRLSRRGSADYDRIVPIARRYERDLVAALDPSERRLLDELLERLTDRARDLREWDEAS